jgi:hypothetical protein
MDVEKAKKLAKLVDELYEYEKLEGLLQDREPITCMVRSEMNHCGGQTKRTFELPEYLEAEVKSYIRNHVKQLQLDIKDFN